MGGKLKVLLALAAVGGGLYWAETNVLRGELVSERKMIPAQNADVIPFEVTRGGQKYSILIEPYDRDGKRANMQLGWVVLSNRNAELVKGSDRVPKGGVRYLRFDSVETGPYTLKMELIRGVGQLDRDTSGKETARLNVVIRRGDRRIVTPWIYWAAAL